MALTICPTCRLPAPGFARNCPLCTAPLQGRSLARNVPIAAAAAAAVVATVAVFARRSRV